MYLIGIASITPLACLMHEAFEREPLDFKSVTFRNTFTLNMNCFLSILGLLWISGITLKFLRFLYLHLRPSSLHRYAYKRGDSLPWAFVTGSSDGVGLAFAHELARAGFNIILHGRNPKKLAAVREALAEEYPESEFRVVVVDVCQEEHQVQKRIAAIVDELQKLHLTVLVNNVGGPPPGMEPLYKPLDANVVTDVEGMISMNIRFTTHITRSVIPLLTASATPGLILNIGSVAQMGLPWVSVYSGAKAFVMSWSAALAREMKAEKRDIEVLGLVLLSVTNVSFRKVVPTLAQPDARVFARGGLQKVGCGRTVVSGYWMHDVILEVLSWLPETVFSNIMIDIVRAEADRDKKRD
jgi:17beta-estradiol 17-dehydrogenase / very-long-chain 3-oxoacyl-CoA reductase